MAAAQPAALGPGDLPTAEECNAKIDELLTELDHRLHSAEVRRRVAVIMAEELEWRPETNTGVVVRNDPRPDIRRYMRYPPNLGESYASASVVPLLVSRGADDNVRWSWEEASLNREAEGATLLRRFQALIPLAHRTTLDRVPDRCRIPDRDLDAALGIYRRVKGTINAAVAKAEKCRYLIQYVRGRNGEPQFPLLQRRVPSMLSDVAAHISQPSGIQREAKKEYAEFVRESFNAHAISPNVDTPAVGVARGP